MALIITSCDDKTTTAPTTNPSITFHLDSVTTNVISRSDFSSQLTSENINIYDFVHGKRKNYKAYPLEEVLKYGFGDTQYALAIFKDSEFLFSALDGFSDTATVSQILTLTGYLAVEDLDVSGTDNWELVANENNNDPAPFYIVWSDSTSQNPTTNNYPWPYELAEIKIID